MQKNLTYQELKRKILTELRVELADEFDKNFERKAFFSQNWKPRQNPKARGTLLMVTGTLRRSIKSQILTDGVRFSSAVPYAAIHNYGGQGTKQVRAHSRKSPKGNTYNVKAHSRKFAMPQRQFLGDGKETRLIVEKIINENLQLFFNQFPKNFNK